jgi:hypothetical protein
VALAAAPAGTSTVRVQVGPELSGTAGVPGYQLPAALLQPGREWIVLNRQLALWILGPDGAASEVVPPPGDPAGTVRVNPSVSLLNGAPALCGSGVSHFVFSDGTGPALGALDVRFGLEARLSLPPTTSGYTIAASAGAGCDPAGAAVSAAGGPLVAGGRYLQIAYGGGGTLQVATVPDRVPATATTPVIALVNAGASATALDVSGPLDDAGGAAMVFAGVAPGALSPWVAAPASDYALTVLERPTVSAALSGGQSFLLVAIGDFAVAGTGPARLVTHKLN